MQPYTPLQETVDLAVIGLGQAGQEVQFAFYKLYQKALKLKTIKDIDEEAIKREIRREGCFYRLKTRLPSDVYEAHMGPGSLLSELMGSGGGAGSGGGYVAYVTCSPVVSKEGAKPLVVMVRADIDPLTLDEIFQAYLDAGLAYVQALNLAPPASLPPSSRAYEVVAKYNIPLGGGGIRQRPQAVYELLKAAEEEGLEWVVRELCLAGCRAVNEPCKSLTKKARALAEVASNELRIAAHTDALAGFYAQFPACIRINIVPEGIWHLGDADRIILMHSLSGTGAGLAVWLLDDHRVADDCSCSIMFNRGAGKVRDIIDVAVAPATEEVEYFPHLPESVKWSMNKLKDYLEGKMGHDIKLTIFLVDLDVAVGQALLNTIAAKRSSHEFFASAELREVNKLLSQVLNTDKDIGNKLRGLHSYAVSKGISHRDADIYIAGSLHPIIAVGWRRVEIYVSNKKVDYSEMVDEFLLHGLVLPSYVPGPLAVMYIDRAAELGEDAETALTLMAAHGLLAPFSRRIDVGVRDVALFMSHGLLKRITSKFGRQVDTGRLTAHLRSLLNRPGLNVKLFTVNTVEGQPEEFNEAMWAYIIVPDSARYIDFLLTKYPQANLE